MNTQWILRAAIVGISLAGLPACSTIKSWFPDKERDYQFTTEIPELIVPDDLKNKGLATLSAPKSESEPEIDSSPVTVSNSDETSEETSIAESTGNNAVSENAETAAPVAGNISSLQIDQAKTPATRMVGRALTRKQVEIVERNVEKGYFYVKYDPNAVEAKDESIWDELNFMFGDDPSQEREYRIRVRGVNSQLSEVTVQDESGKPLSDDAANALLKLITDGINQVLSQPESDEGGAVDGETKPGSGVGSQSESEAKPESISPKYGPMVPVIQE